jgi:non-specific serine/threonine protein kinase
LVDKSLVVTETTSDGALRHGMLEPIRQYAREKLEEDSEAEAVHMRHAEFFLALAEAAETKLLGPEQVAWLDRLEAEHDNLRAALFWTLEQGEAEIPLRLAGALYRFWWMRGYFEEGLRWLERALSTTTAPLAARAKALQGAGLAALQGDNEQATLLFEESLYISQELGDKAATADALHNLGVILYQRGEYARARRAFEESRILSRELDDEQGVAFALGGLGDVAYFQGDYEYAGDFYEKSLALHRKFGDRHSVAIVLNNLGEVANIRGDYERAATLAQESLVLFRELGGKLGMAQALLTLVEASFEQGDHRQATALIGDSLSISRELGTGVVAAEGLDMLAKLALAHGEPARAARLFGGANGLRESAGAALTPYTRSELERYASPARGRLDQATWEAAWAEGKAMGLKEAVEYALSEEETAIPVPPASERPSADASSALTRREGEVAALVARGLTNRQVGAELTISEHTAATHVRKILKKLGLRSRSQLSAWVAQQGLPPSELS